MNITKIIGCGVLVSCVAIPAVAAINLCARYEQGASSDCYNDSKFCRKSSAGATTEYYYVFTCGESKGTWNGVNGAINAQTTITSGTDNVACWVRIVSPVLTKWIQVNEYSSASQCNSECVNAVGGAIRGQSYYMLNEAKVKTALISIIQ